MQRSYTKTARGFTLVHLGWAILVVVVVVGLLWIFGVFDPPPPRFRTTGAFSPADVSGQHYIENDASQTFFYTITTIRLSDGQTVESAPVDMTFTVSGGPTVTPATITTTTRGTVQVIVTAPATGNGAATLRAAPTGGSAGVGDTISQIEWGS